MLEGSEQVRKGGLQRTCLESIKKYNKCNLCDTNALGNWILEANRFITCAGERFGHWICLWKNENWTGKRLLCLNQWGKNGSYGGDVTRSV